MAKHIFGLFMVAQSGLRMATDGPGSWRSERRRSGHRPLSLPSSVAVLQCCHPLSLPSLQSQSVLTESPRVLSSVRRIRLCTAYWQSHYHFGWAQDSSPRTQKHEERLKRRKNILELSHIIENYICNWFIACHWSDSSGTGLITSENTTIDCYNKKAFSGGFECLCRRINLCSLRI